TTLLVGKRCVEDADAIARSGAQPHVADETRRQRPRHAAAAGRERQEEIRLVPAVDEREGAASRHVQESWVERERVEVANMRLEKLQVRQGFAVSECDATDGLPPAAEAEQAFLRQELLARAERFA